MRRRSLTALTAALALVAGLLTAPPLAATPVNAAATSAPASGATAKERSGTVSGKVTFRGEPVAGARVAIQRVRGRFFTKTDAQGRFSEKVPPGRYRVWAESQHVNAHQTWFGNTIRRLEGARLEVSAGGHARARIKLQRAVAIEGQVFGADGEPAAGIELRAKNLTRHDVSSWATTDEDGRYTFHGLTSGATLIGPWGREGELEGSITVPVKRRQLTVTAPDLHLSAAQLGTVAVRLDGGEDLDLWAIAYEVGGDRSVGLRQDSQTGLWLGKVPAGTWRIWVVRGEVLSDEVRVEHGQTVDVGPLTIPSERGSLKIAVLDKNGKQLRSGEVLISDRHGHDIEWDYLFRLKKKRYTSPDLVPGTYYISVFNSRFPKKLGVPARPQKVDVTAGSPTKATIRLEKGRTVSGTVRHQGKPVRGIYVAVRDPAGRWDPHGSTKTDAQGRFVLKHVPRGRLHLKVFDTSPKYRVKTLPIKARGAVTNLRIKVKS